MRRVQCADLVPGCYALIEGTTENEIVLQFRIHVALKHRDWPIALEDLLAAVTSVPQCPPSKGPDAAAAARVSSDPSLGHDCLSVGVQIVHLIDRMHSDFDRDRAAADPTDLLEAPVRRR